MHNKLIDNTQSLKLVDTIKELLSEKDKDGNFMINHIQIATGYWDLPGTNLLYSHLKDFFAHGGKFQLLIGKEPELRDYQIKSEAKSEGKFPDFNIKNDIDKLTDDYVDVARLILNNTNLLDESQGNFQIRVYGQNGPEEKFLHAKCYIFYKRNDDDVADEGYGIIGSSNFTKRGLNDNEELNFLETDYNSVCGSGSDKYKTHERWFKEKWDCSLDWTGHFINEILKKSPVGIKAQLQPQPANAPAYLTPYEVYIKYLQLQFGDMIDANTTEILKSYLPASFNPLTYQMDAVKQCFSVMKRYGGFLLGDVVGLGKTVVGVLLIRYFLEQAASLGRANKVLIITPPAIKAGWENTIREFDKSSLNQIEPNVSFVTTGSVGKLIDTDDLGPFEDEADNIEDIKVNDYGLILIDESHNFRNSDTQKYQAVDDLIGLINPTPYVALLSATPQNNSPRDLYNQIRLFQRDANNTTLPGVPEGKLDSFFNEKEKEFKIARAIDQDTDQGKEKARLMIAQISKEIRQCVLNELMVRRTRTDIRKMYGEDAELLKFPTVKGPHKLEYKMDNKLQKLFYDSTEAISLLPNETFDPNRHIGFYRYTAIAELKNDTHKKLYEKRNLTVESITRRLKRIMQILLVKRLESSITAFKQTLRNLRRYNDVMIDMINHDCVYICPDIDINKIHQDCNKDFKKFRTQVDALIEKKQGNNRKFKATDFKDTYLDELKNDKKLIEDLLERWNANTYDPKRKAFNKAVLQVLFDKKINNPSSANKQRLVIFSEAIDTIEEIVDDLKEDHKVLKITAENRSKDQKKIIENFDANLGVESQKDDYDVIVTTEVLAEGVNLHRANVILNYDTPWNATRLMQRIGRVNRIGSTEEFVHVFNFFPSVEGNKQIRLVEKAYAKLQSFHEMFGEDNKVFSELEELSEHDLQKFVEGEESPFAPFIQELKKYHDNYPARYEELSSIEAKNLGGKIAQSNHAKYLFLYTDKTRAMTSITVENSEDEPKAHVVSSLDTMQLLECGEETSFDPDAELCKSIEEIARSKYRNFVTKATTSKDMNKKANKALEIISSLRSRDDISEESLDLLDSLETSVESLNTFVIKKILSFNPNVGTIFGTNDDINELFRIAFDNLVQTIPSGRGKPELIIFEEK